MNDYSSRRKFFKLAGAGTAAVAMAGAFVQPSAIFAAQNLTQSVRGSVLGATAPDAQMQAVLAALAALNAPPIETTTPEVARQLPTAADAVMAVLSAQSKPTVEPVGKVDHKIIQGPGGQLLMRVYTPQGSGPFPVLVYFHGGGWVIATLDTYDASCRALTNAAKCIVVSVAYRQAPEHKFPAAVDDAYAAYQWVLGNAATIGGDPNRVAVGGESAGGNLAAVTSIKARNNGIKLPIYQMLVYPVTDFTSTTPSLVENANAMPLSTAGLKWFGNYYLNSPADQTNPDASPLLADSLKGLPPAFIVTADIDPLRDQGEAYKGRLLEAGISVVGARYTGVTHEFFGMAGAVDTAKQAVSDVAYSLRLAFGTIPPQ